ncbi:MAG: VWA domain-containing protein [Deltaproteobacteria bacterium]|nr:VWA domain-containing protein [Deltaproteobacteria bacterium]
MFSIRTVKNVFCFALLLFLVAVSRPASAATVSSDGGITLTLSYCCDLYDARTFSGHPDLGSVYWEAWEKIEYDMRELSWHLYHASEGAHYIKRVYVAGDAKAWSTGDLRWSLTPNDAAELMEAIGSTPTTCATIAGWRKPTGHLNLFQALVFGMGRLALHEFGHYFYSLADEYARENYYHGVFKEGAGYTDAFDVTVPEGDHCPDTIMDTGAHPRLCDSGNHQIRVLYTDPFTDDPMDEVLTSDLVGTLDEGPLRTGGHNLPYAIDGWGGACVEHIEMCDRHTVDVWPDYEDADIPPTDIVYIEPGDDVVGRVILIDRSGSMDHLTNGRAAVDYAQEAALYFFNISIGSYAGATVYNDEIEELFPYAIYDTEYTSFDFYDAVDMTDIRAALEAALTQLTTTHTDAEELADTEIFLLSDGKQTVDGDLFEQVDIAQELGVKIHTFSYGDADTATMDSIAAATEGQVYYMFDNDDNGQYLKLGMIEAIADSSGLTPLHTYTGQLPVSGVTADGTEYHKLTFVAPAGTANVGFYLLPFAGTAQQYRYEITDPAGNIFTSNLTPLKNQGRYLGTEIAPSKEGLYTVVIYPVRTSQFVTDDVQLLAYANNRLLETETGSKDRFVSLQDPHIVLQSSIAFGYPLTNVDVVTRLLTPDGLGIAQIKLVDNGQLGDEVAGDGVYSARVKTSLFRGIKSKKFRIETRFNVTDTSIPAPEAGWNSTVDYQKLLSGWNVSPFTAYAKDVGVLTAASAAERAPYLDTSLVKNTYLAPGKSYRDNIGICNAMPDNDLLRIRLGNGIKIIGISHPQGDIGDPCVFYPVSYRVSADAEPGVRDLSVQFGGTILTEPFFAEVSMIGWLPGIEFLPGQLVEYLGKIWKCIFGHTSQVDWYPGAPGVYLWTEVAQSNEWVANKFYTIGDIVAFDGKEWECNFPHISQTDWTPGIVWFWTEVVQADKWVEYNWYTADDIVTYEGEKWKCILPHFSLGSWYPGAPFNWFWVQI